MKSTIIIIILVTLVSLHLYHHYYILTSTKEGFRIAVTTADLSGMGLKNIYIVLGEEIHLHPNHHSGHHSSHHSGEIIGSLQSTPSGKSHANASADAHQKDVYLPGTHPEDCVWASDCNCCGYLQ